MHSETKKYRSTCSYCGVGCGILLSFDTRGKLQVEGDPDHPANKGMLCSKGKNLNYVVDKKDDRILYPEMRWDKNSPRTRVSWDTALNRAVSVFKTLISKYGPDSVGFYVSGQLLTEEYYIVNKLAKGFLGTNNIDTNSRLCMSSAVVGYKLSLGEDAVPLSYDDIELGDCFFITGANPAWCHPIIFRRLEAHKANNPDIKIIVSDPRRTQSAVMADLHLQIAPGTDIYMHYGLTRWLIEHNFADEEFIKNHTTGFNELKEKVMQYSLDEVADICKVKKEDIELAAQWIGEAKGFISMWAMGLNQSVIGVNKNLSLINLSLVTGKIGKPGNGPFSLTGQPNAMGGREVGGLSNLLPAHRNMDNPAHREEVARFWGVDSVPAKPGYSATEMFEALAQDKLKAIWIICTNPLVSLPNVRLVEEAMKKARFVVVQDISNNTISNEYADLILPAAGWAEKEGTMTNSDRRISYLSKVKEPPGDARADTEILMDFAKRMGFHGFDFASSAEIHREYADITAGTNIDISGLDYEKLKKGTVQWPYPKDSINGTTRLFTDNRFYTPDFKAKIHNPEPENLSEPVSMEFPFVLTTGRIRDQWHTMTRTGKVNRLNQHLPEAYVEINPADAITYKILDGDVVEVWNAYGNVRVRAKVTTEIKPGVLFLPMHWGKILNSDLVRANNLTSSRIDARSKEPDFKFSNAAVKKYQKNKERVVVIGAGAAAFKFVTEYRKKNSFDEIHVFSAEEYPFYNRVLLPDLISGSKTWDQLQKATYNEINDLEIKIHTSNPIIKINRDSKSVVDSEGIVHKYDTLIMATGSKPQLPNYYNPKIDGLFSLRTKYDADRIKAFVKPGEPVVLVGAGLLSLEMVAAMLETGNKVNLINRGSSLMSRQLDKIASTMLRTILEEQGANLYFNDEIETLSKLEDGYIKVVLKSGHRIKSKAVIFAIGTSPNIELAKETGIKVKRGVLVNDHLQSSDTSVYAIGEIAEHNEDLYGITTVAEEQAEIAAKYLLGDISSVFTGSVSMNILKYPGLELCSIGLTDPPASDPSYEEIIFFDKSQRYYKKCIIKDNIMVGAILFGDKFEFNEFRDLIKNKTELSEKRITILRSGKTAKPVKGKIVCSCNNIGEGNLIDEINNNTTDFESLCKTTGAGTVCGSCRPEVNGILLQNLKPVFA